MQDMSLCSMNKFILPVNNLLLYCQAQSQLKHSWTELALLSTYTQYGLGYMQHGLGYIHYGLGYIQHGLGY